MKARSLSTLVMSLLVLAFGTALPGLPAVNAAIAAPVPTRYPLSVVDDTGATMQIAAAPRRIVSLTLPSDEILLSLVEPARLIGVTNFAPDAGISSVAGRIPAAATILTLNVETIISMKPDLVIVANWSDAAAVKQLRDAKLPVYLISSGKSVSDIEDRVRRLGLLTDRAAAAEDMVARMEARLAAVAEKVGKLPAGQRLSVMDFSPYGASMGKGSSWNEIILRAGLVNAVGDKTPDEWGQVALSRESLLQISPDFLVLPGWIYGDAKGSAKFLEQITKDPALQTLSAVKNGRALVMPENLKSSTSQYIVDAVEWLARTAYPALFR